MSVMLAVKTLEAIDSALEKDQGGKYRQILGTVIPHMADAFRGADEGFRTHLGASLIGGECSRALWYGFRWATKPKFSGRILRLFNRGHLEEARFISLLLMIGCTVYQQDEKGNQFRISGAGAILAVPPTVLRSAFRTCPLVCHVLPSLRRTVKRASQS